MTTGENQTEPVVHHVMRFLRRFYRKLDFFMDFAPAPPQPVDGLEPAGRDQPRARVRGCTLDRPLLDRRRERILQRLLGEIEIAEETNQGREDTARLGAIDRLDRVYGWSNSITGRTSTVPCCAPGIRDATWTASFRSFALIR